MKKTVIILSIVILSIIGGLYIAGILFFNPFDFGPCDGNGPPNGEKKYYYDNGKLKRIGTTKNCLWQGLVKNYYESGELESLENYQQGRRNGSSLYFTKDSVAWKQEYFIDGSLTAFSVTDLKDQSIFIFVSDTLKFLHNGQIKFINFTHPISMSGYDEPFVSLYNGKLLLRGDQDYYVVNKNLEIEINLRDTLMKFIPTAYNEKTDHNGNKHTFLWHRNISNDSLKLKVFYDGDSSQSNLKIWEQVYIFDN